MTLATFTHIWYVVSGGDDPTTTTTKTYGVKSQTLGHSFILQRQYIIYHVVGSRHFDNLVYWDAIRMQNIINFLLIIQYL